MSERDKPYDFLFHCQALNSHRWRNNCHLLHLFSESTSFEKMLKNSLMLSKLSHIVSRLRSLRSLRISIAPHAPDNDGNFRVKVDESNCVNTRLMDYILPNDYIENFWLDLESSRSIKPSTFPFDELMDRQISKSYFWNITQAI